MTMNYIILKGYLGRRVFYESQDYSRCIDLMKKYKRACHIRIFGYCLLPRTVHFVLQSQHRHEAQSFIYLLRQSYFSYFVSKYCLNERLWHQNFREITIDNEADLLIHLKAVEFCPVKARITDNPLRYPWSSCSYRVLSRGRHIIDVEPFVESTFTLKR